MKPRTQFEKQVVVSNARLTPISNKVIDWALRTQIDHIAFRTSGTKCTCGACGVGFKHEGKGKYVVCPHCGKRVRVVDTMKRTMDDIAYFNTTEAIDGMQVVRTFRLNVRGKKGLPETHEIEEICRMWLNSKGQTALTSKRRSLGYYADSFVADSEIELKTLQSVHEVISDRDVYPHYSMIPELKRNGLKGPFPYCHPFYMMKYILTDSRMETLIKFGSTKGVAFFTGNHIRLDKCWDSLKIAFRHGYEPTDYAMWCDTLSILERLGRDIRNPKYICPQDLKMAHRYWDKKYREAERKRREREQLAKAIKDEKQFIVNKGRYFGIVIKDSDITISVLDSIKAYKAEGDAMHHCVFSDSYYDIPDSIVLSARDKDGNRIETVEFSLEQGRVIQSRGVCNKNTEYHDRIVNLVNANAHRFELAKATA